MAFHKLKTSHALSSGDKVKPNCIARLSIVHCSVLSSELMRLAFHCGFIANDWVCAPCKTVLPKVCSDMAQPTDTIISLQCSGVHELNAPYVFIQLKPGSSTSCTHFHDSAE